MSTTNPFLKNYLDEANMATTTRKNKIVEKTVVITTKKAANKKEDSTLVKLGTKYYKKDEEAFEIDGTYYLAENTAIDNYTNKRALKNNLRSAYIGLNKKDVVYTSKTFQVVGSKMSGEFCFSSLDKALDSGTLMKYPSNDRDVYIRKGDCYVSGTDRDKIVEKYGKIYSISAHPLAKEKVKLTEFKNRIKFSNLGFTYGFEIETSAGLIPTPITDKLGFAKLYDGSISGNEYTSLIFSESNFGNLYELLNLLSVSHAMDVFSSFHIHIGNVPYSDKNLLSIYSLYKRIEEELNAILPPYKKHFNYLAGKGKDHCQNLVPLVNKTVDEIYEILHVAPGSTLNPQKWGNTTRYYNVNFLNYITSGGTIEIRSLQSTFSVPLVNMWIYIHTKLIEYALDNPKKIMDGKDKILLSEILDACGETGKLVNRNIDTIKNFYLRNYIIPQRYDSKNFSLSKLDSELYDGLININK